MMPTDPSTPPSGALGVTMERRPLRVAEEVRRRLGAAGQALLARRAARRVGRRAPAEP